MNILEKKLSLDSDRVIRFARTFFTFCLASLDLISRKTKNKYTRGIYFQKQITKQKKDLSLS